MTAQPSSQAEREDERVSVPRRYVQHLIVCDLNMRMGAKCQCGLSAPGVVRPDREHAPEIALTHPEVYDLANATPRSMPEEVEREGCVGAMNAERAVYFLERFKRDEKMLGPHEQWALDFTIRSLIPGASA